MVLTINQIHPQNVTYTDTVKGPDPLSKIAAVFRKSMSDISFFLRGVSAFFSWGLVLPVGQTLQTLSSAIRTQISAMTAFFNIPRFFLNYYDLYNACSDLWKSATGTVPNALASTVAKVKKVFTTSIYSALSSISVLQLIDRYIIKLPSQVLTQLSKGQTVLNLLSSSIRFVESAYAFGDQAIKDWHAKAGSSKLISLAARMLSISLLLAAKVLSVVVAFTCLALAPLAAVLLFVSSLCTFSVSAWTLGHQAYTDWGSKAGGGASPKLVKSAVTMCSDSLRLVSSGLRAAIAFLGVSLGTWTALIFTLLSSGSFLFDVISKILTQSNLVYKNDAHLRPSDLSHLPA